MQPLRIAVLGAGMIGREHIALVQDSADCQLVAVAVESAAPGELGKTFGVPCYTGYEALLEQESLDAVIVALPNALHLNAGLACIERGLPVLMEKPVADSLASGLALAEASESSGVAMLIGHHRRHSPDMIESRRAIDAGELGRLVAVNGVWWCKKHDGYFEPAWRRKLGAGPVLNNLVHDIDCLRYLCGEIDSVQAMTANQARGFEVEDSFAVSLSFANGAIGTLVGSDSVPSPFMWDVASGQSPVFPHQPEPCYQIGGSLGCLSVPTMELWHHQEGEDWRNPLYRRRLQPLRHDCYPRQMAHFIDVVRGERAPVIDARDGLMTLAATLACDRAARTGMRVRVQDMLDCPSDRAHESAPG
ncbi:Gfo/Idh/MocA family oxidoreductase [Halomonas sp. OfavH-34-E]|nr:Gfo/Idh/MocA family oxidoreductase [Halomonas sp. OfavH-34-E]MCO7216207.1 Gfo/Idh/MocA family oxidoreductase [Halomonas sp. OfavH-34-E]